MISFGKFVKDNNSELIKISHVNFFKALVNPKDETKQKILNLRNVLTINKDKYKTLKTNLPYICCSIFNPPLRNTANFAYTQYFIIDIDNISGKQLKINTLKEKLKENKQILLMFNSPSNDGLKIMFKLSEKCFDSAKYSIFYKNFAINFSKQYGLEQVLDIRTNDVTRACFVSYDSNAYYNQNAENVEIKKTINFDNVFELKNKNLEFEKLYEKNTDKNTNNIPDDIFAEIKKKLSAKLPTQTKEKIIYTPIELNNILDKIKLELNEFNIEITEITNINYGKKIKTSNNQLWAEINIFYGKKGFSVVKSPKRGSNSALCDICAKIIENIL